MKTHISLVAVCAVLLFLAGCDECRDDGDCSDGLFCNGEERCHGGDCISGAPNPCDDSIVCTVDSCDEEMDECHHEATDGDGDGHFARSCEGDDCDDSNASIYAGAPELCDGLDNDCDGDVDEDLDGDGYYSIAMCAAEGGDDCDDSDPSVHPGAAETCDGVDSNCVDGIDDEEDTDGDGSIDPTCGGDDCDDEEALIFPGATEMCNGVDDDCDDESDETFACVMGATYGCETECGTVGTIECSSMCTISGDCEPPDEVCNGYDDDCDGDLDEDFDCVYGAEVECSTSCGTNGVGYCTFECVPPGAEACAPPEEVCNGVDDDCDGSEDEGFDCTAGKDAPCVSSCGTTGVGRCSDTCQLPEALHCTPPAEVCDDLIDNDCDGDEDCVDEDCIGEMVCGG